MAFLLAGSMDCLTTVVGIAYFGAIELNPFMSNLVSSSLVEFIAIKLTAVLIVALMFHQANKALVQNQSKSTLSFKLANKTLKISYIGATVVLLAAVINNLIVFARLA
jgi:hypothetical protein